MRKNYAKFGKKVFELVADAMNDDPTEDTEALLQLAEGCGLVCHAPYDIKRHGKEFLYLMEPGDLMWSWNKDDLKKYGKE